ncbi:hypothetical protein L6452_38761 [Arctium lappa]|uniref:Uncharacterized protein n=1 Tax=Arctium lappa TaxID=4217 RepID=A0ACB8XRK5_ARCLA|nr:hypothetical protein L6452_38761 [Arctium lappa]
MSNQLRETCLCHDDHLFPLNSFSLLIQKELHLHVCLLRSLKTSKAIKLFRHSSKELKTTHLLQIFNDFKVAKNKHLARLDVPIDKYPHLLNVANFLKESCLGYALKVDPVPSKDLLQQFWYTADKGAVQKKKGEPIPAITFQTQHGPGNITALAIRTALRFPSKTKSGFDPLPTYAELIKFLDHMEYQWDFKPRTTVPNKKLTKIQKSSSLTSFKALVERSIFERDTKIPYVRFVYAIPHFLLGDKYPKDNDYHLSKVGLRVFEVKKAENEVSLQTIRFRLSQTSLTSVATPMVHSSAIPITTTPHKRKSTAPTGPSNKAKKTVEHSLSTNVPEVVSQQTTLDDFVSLSSMAAQPSTVSGITIADTPPVTAPIPLVTQAPAENQFAQLLTSFSGPTLGTVDTSVNKLAKKVESLETSLNTNTTTASQVDEELKNISSTIATKDELTSLQSEQAGECHSTAHSDSIKSECTSSRFNSLFYLERQSVSDVDVEFIHKATSDIPAIEGHVEKNINDENPADAQEETTDEPLSYAEGEKDAEENVTEDQTPPSSSLAQEVEDKEKEEEEEEE